MELAVSVAIGSIMFLILGAIFLAQGRYFDIENAIAETQYNGFQALDTTGLYAGSAVRVMASRTVNGTAYTTDATLVVLELPSIDADGDIINNTYDYVAIGQDPSDAAKFMFDIDKGAGSTRLDGKFVKALLVDKLIFRYNAVDPAAATAIELYVRTSKNARERTIKTPLGKIYYLGGS